MTASISDIQVGCIGVGGQGLIDLQSVGRLATVTAICDVDEGNLAAALRLFPAARPYIDYRDLLDDPQVDGVTISTPDHQHGAIALGALQRGKHCFCQKPLALTVSEIRQIAESSRTSGLATQMGLQGVTHSRARRAVDAIRSGVLGEIFEIHAWTDRPGVHWSADVPTSPSERIPAGLHWDEWLGSTPYRPYQPAYHPSGWRGWMGLGTGALGDMGTHNTAIAFMALELGVPTSVSGLWAPVVDGQFPAWSMLDLVLPTKRDAGTIVLHWYDGGKLPPASIVDDIRMDDNGCVLVGTGGRAYLPGSMNQYLYLLPRDRFRAVVLPELHPTLDVYEEWLRACSDHRPTTCNFAGHSATITEAMLVANLAIQLGRSIEWDADLAQVRSAPDGQRFNEHRGTES